MDKEEFNLNELQSIKEFQPFKAEFFGVPEHSRPKMEQYKLPEIADSSLPEKPIQENEQDGYSKKLMENANGSGSGSAPGSASSGTSGAGGGTSAGGAGGAGSSSAAGGSSAAAGSTAASAASSTAAGFSAGAIAITAAVGGAALGIVPIEPKPTPPEPPIVEPEPPIVEPEPEPPVIDKNFGDFELKGYETRAMYIDDIKCQIIDFCFVGNMNPGFEGKFIDKDKNKEYLLPAEIINVQNPYEEKSYNFSYEIKNTEFDEVVYSKDIVVQDLGIDFDAYYNNIGFSTRYVTDGDCYNVYFYFETTYQDQPDAYPFFELEAEFYDPRTDENRVVLANKEVDNGGINDIYSLLHLPSPLPEIRINPYIKIGHNRFMYESPGFFNFNDDIGFSCYAEAQLFHASSSLETITSDIDMEITHQDGIVEKFVIPNAQVTNGHSFERLLEKHSDKYSVKATYTSQVPEWDFMNLIPDELKQGELTRTRVYTKECSGSLVDAFGDYMFDKATMTNTYPDTVDPSNTLYDYELSFTGSIEPYFYAKICDPVSGEEIRLTTPSVYNLTGVPFDVTDVVVNIYTEKYTPTEVDDCVIYKMVCPLDSVGPL